MSSAGRSPDAPAEPLRPDGEAAGVAPDALAATVRALAERVERLEAELESLRSAHVSPEVPEDVVVAISAAVAAFLGHRAKVKQVHYRTGQAWAQQGRAVVQGHHNIHNRSR